jgi:long-chain acyl-CoA synthetase
MSLNIASQLDYSATKYPEHAAIILEGKRITYRELLQDVRKVAEALRDCGVRKGDSVLLMAPNVPEFTIAYFATLYLGAVVVPINPQLLAPEIIKLLEYSDAKVFLAWHTFAEKAVDAFRAVESCSRLFFIGNDTPEFAKNAVPTSKTDESLYQRIGILEPQLADKPGTISPCQCASSDPGVLLYTSGTTGKPKGALLSQFNLFSNALYAWRDFMDVNNGDVAIAILPLFHTFGQSVIQNATLIAGGTMLLLQQFEPKKALALIEAHKVTHLAAVPTMHHLMLQTQKRHKVNTSSLRWVASGGASLPLALFNEYKEIFALEITEMYGLSETSPIATSNPLHGLKKPGSIGPAIFGTEVRIMREDHSFADVEETGELVIRGHNVMLGYYKDPLSTDAAIVDGWFHTGDIGKMDADGYFYIIDRKKDVIIRGGMNIYPREIEEILLHHPAIQQVAVVGIADNTLSENVIAFVCLHEGYVAGENITSEALLKYCREHLAAYKCPKTFHFLANLPKGPSGKILKRELRDGHY